MALRALPDPDGDPQPDAEQTVSTCPVCDGRMELVYDRHHQKVVVCVDCQSGLTVPQHAWEIARIKRETKWMPGRT
jgi:ssDNA-binding Zn-finger/Zn-ribbon topoisomerase 1